MEGFERVEVKKVAGPIEGGAAVFLGNERKTFVIFVGIFEATAILKEIQNQRSPRPLTHDLIHSILLGFDVVVKEVRISKLVENTFCATLILEQQLTGENGEFSGRRNEVRIDARASDSIVIALKEGADIWVANEVLEAVDDVGHKFGQGSPPEHDWGEFGSGLGFDVDEGDPEDL